MKNILCALLICIYYIPAQAQVDPHFSQYYAQPLWLNPALTGVIDGDYRASLNIKRQWESVSNPYSTGSASFDRAPVKQLALGATILNQSSGEIDFNYLNILISSSYRIRLGYEGQNIINFGLQAGVINRSFDVSKARLGSQYDPSLGYNPTMPMDENFASSSSLVPDINAGIAYFDANPGKRINMFGGFSTAHLTRPVDKFTGDNRRRIPIRYILHGGGRIKISESVDITPNVLFMRQGNAKENAAGVYGKFILQTDADLLFGTSYRFNDSAIAFAGLKYKDFVFGVSYDVNTSSLQRATNGRGGLEFSMSFTRRKGIIGPNFFCPRL